MKILHISFLGPFTDGWTYQENLLLKYHKKNGHEVTMITSKFKYNNDGEIDKSKKSEYNYNGIKIIRLKTFFGLSISSKFKRFKNLYYNLEKEKPEIIFIHGCQFLDIKVITNFLKENPKVDVYIDNHADKINSAKNLLSREILHKIIWKYFAKMIEPYTKTFYGVLPSRSKFLSDFYNIPENKIKLLVMGADDEKVEEAINGNSRKKIRKKYNINEDDFIIMTGGKIDDNKLEVFNLMDAVNDIKDDKIKLIIFGSIQSDYKNKFDNKLSDKVKYIGWINPEKIYIYLNTAELLVFPGLHSVLWEQSIGLGKPCIFKYIQDFTHVDLGGNCLFLHKNDVDEIKNKILKVYNKPSLFKKMKKVAETKGRTKFSYKKIAEKSIKDTVDW